MMNDLNFTTQSKKEVYDLIKTIYKFIPVYNKIKGTYIGVQFVLRMMGLCASIVELWSNKDDISNFAKDTTYYREDEIKAVRRFITDIAEDSEIKNFYLTSKFDVDILDSGLTFVEFNGMASTIVTVINSIRPVTRALRKLWYNLNLELGLHFNYQFTKHNIEISGDILIDGILTEDTPIENNIILEPIWFIVEEKTGIHGEKYTLMVEKHDENGPHTGNGDAFEDKEYGLSVQTVNYLWKLNKNNITSDNGSNSIKSIFLPYRATLAKGGTISGGTSLNDILTDTYFNFFDLNLKLKKSQQKEFRFILYKKSLSEPLKGCIYDSWIIGESINIELLQSGIVLHFLNNLLAENIDLSSSNTLFLGTNFNLVLGTNYIYQNKSVDLNIWGPYINAM